MEDVGGADIRDTLRGIGWQGATASLTAEAVAQKT
jgi:hypothetical protein